MDSSIRRSIIGLALAAATLVLPGTALAQSPAPLSNYSPCGPIPAAAPGIDYGSMPEGWYVTGPITPGQEAAVLAAAGLPEDPFLQTFSTVRFSACFVDGQMGWFVSLDDGAWQFLGTGAYKVTAPSTLVDLDEADPSYAGTTWRFSTACDALRLAIVDFPSSDLDGKRVALEFSAAPFVRQPSGLMASSAPDATPCLPPTGSPLPSPGGAPSPAADPSPVGSVDATTLDGTYTTVLTQAEAEAGGVDDACTTQPGGAHLKLTLDGSEYAQFESCLGTPESLGDDGRYKVDGHSLVKVSAGDGNIQSYTWSLTDGVLRLRNLVPPDVMFDHDWVLEVATTSGPPSTSAP